MKIGIIGGGSIGLLISAYLARHHEVTVITRSMEQTADLNEHGLAITKNNIVSSVSVKATSLSQATLREFDLIILAVKQYQLEDVLPFVKEVDSPLLFVQNGMGHMKYLERLAHTNEVYVGVVEHGALKTSQTSVTHTGQGVIKLASYKGDLERMLFLSADDAFPFIFEVDYREMLIHKLMVNAMINPLTAVLSVPNGELLTNQYYSNLLHTYFEEVVNIVNPTHPNQMLQHVKVVCSNTAHNRSSMLRDLEEKRPTEIDSILGYILELAEEKQVSAPITQTLYNMIKGKE